MKLLSPAGVVARLRDRGVPLSGSRVRELDAELRPLRIDSGSPNGDRVYKAALVDRFIARRKAGAR